MNSYAVLTAQISPRVILLPLPNPSPSTSGFLRAELLALAPVVRLIFQTLIHDMQTTYDKRPGRTGKEKGCSPGATPLLDEAGRVEIPKLYEYATTVVGRQISLWVAIQSIKQLDAIYGQANAETLLDNMDTQIFYRQRRATAKYLEDRA